MATITGGSAADIKQVAAQIADWFHDKRFQVEALSDGSNYLVKARKASGVRAAVGADRALVVEVSRSGGELTVDVRQGSWKTNAVSNAAWLVATGGMNLAISGWSVVVQKELEGYVRSLLTTSQGYQPVEL